MVKEIKNSVEFHQALKDAGNKLVVVDFTATWCGPCRMIAPKFEELAGEHKDVVFLKVDVDKAQDVAKERNISCMPTFQFFKNGGMVHEFKGANVKELIEQVKKLE